MKEEEKERRGGQGRRRRRADRGGRRREEGTISGVTSQENRKKILQVVRGIRRQHFQKAKIRTNIIYQVNGES